MQHRREASGGHGSLPGPQTAVQLYVSGPESRSPVQYWVIFDQTSTGETSVIAFTQSRFCLNLGCAFRLQHA
jgi:hypothetical protein